VNLIAPFVETRKSYFLIFSGKNDKTAMSQKEGKEKKEERE
jgi:hypothetical protein